MKNQAAAHRARLAVDICVFRRREAGHEVLLIRRDKAPFKGSWALPGGRLEAHETLDQCAVRELQEETGLRPLLLRHFANFSDPDRDPRERTVSAAYIARVADDATATAGSDAAAAAWYPVSELPPLAFDHRQILQQGLSALQHLPGVDD